MERTVVAVFQSTERAKDAKRELVNAGFRESDVSIAIQTATDMPKGRLGKLKLLLGVKPKFRESGTLTVYVDPQRTAEAERLVRRCQPTYVQTRA